MEWTIALSQISKKGKNSRRVLQKICRKETLSLSLIPEKQKTKRRKKLTRLQIKPMKVTLSKGNKLLELWDNKIWMSRSSLK
jgi:hypothetical protein